MATSGVYTIETFRNKIINRAFKKLNLLPKGTSLAAEDLQEGAEQLNSMVKSWQADDIYLWKFRTVYLFLQKGQNKYTLSPTGDHAALEYFQKATTAPSSSGATSVTLDSVSNLVAGYNIGILLSDNRIFWTTIDSIVGNVVNLDDALTSNVVSGAIVFSYDQKVQKPLKMKYATFKNSQGYEIPLNYLARKDYQNLPLKSYTAAVDSQIAFEPLTTSSLVWLNPAPADASYVAVLNVVYPFEVFESANDDADFPEEWMDTLIYCLAERLMPDYGCRGERKELILNKANELFNKLLDYDREDTYLQIDINVRPYSKWGR